MKSKKNEEDARRIISFFKDNNFDRLATVKHFIAENMNERTIRRVVERFLKNGQIEYNKNSGPKPSILTTGNLNKIKKRYVENPNISVRQCATQLKIKKSNIQNAKKKLNIITRKKKIAPKYINDQENRAEKACMKLYRKVVPSGGSKFIVMDDETYVPCDPEQIPGNDYYNIVEGAEVDKSVMIKHKQKFYKKFGVWQAMAQDGNVSKSYVFTGTINAQIYLEKCIRPILIPFIRQYNENHDVLFWPDLASSHYADIIRTELNEKNINFVSKKDNSPNTPQNRPIETYWALCKQEYKLRNKVCDDITKFRRQWTMICKTVAEKHGKNLFHNFKRKLYQTGKNGVFAYINKK